MFVGDRPAETPDRRLRHGHRLRRAPDAVRSAGDRPEARSRGPVDFRKGLHRLQDAQATQDLRRVQRGHRCTIRQRRVQAPKVHNRATFGPAIQRGANDSLHLLRARRIDCESVHARGSIRLSSVDQYRTFPSSTKVLRKLITDAVLIGEDQPHPRLLRPGRRHSRWRGFFVELGPLSKDHAVQRLLSNVGVGDARDIGEAQVLQQRLPLLLRDPWVRGAQARVGKPPPASKEAEDQHNPLRRVRELEQNQQTARPKQLLDVPDGFPQVARRVEHVGSHDHVEGMRLIALRDRIALDVQQLVLHEWEIAEFLLCLTDEQLGHVAEHILGAVRR